MNEISEEKKEQKVMLTKTVKEIIVAMPIGTKFHAWELEREVKKIWKKHPDSYTDTIMRVARRVARDYFKCISIPRSLYERV